MDRQNAEYNPENKHSNIRHLRQYLKLTQKGFLERFFSDEEGNLKMSTATLSNLESRGGAQLDEVIATLSDSLSIDAMSFALDAEQFAAQMEAHLSESSFTENIRSDGERRGNISHLVNRLTMYFADEIMSGNLHRGDQIESDRMLAKRMGVGRSAIREALKVLDVMGMIEIHPGQGTYISSRESNFFIIPLSWSIFMNGNQIESVLAVRDLLEIEAAALAADCRDERKLARLGDIFHEMQTTYGQRDYREFLDLDMEFHSAIAECSNNPVIFSVNQSIRNLLKRVSETGMVDADQVHEIYEEHQRIYGNIISGNSKGAGEAMKEHMERSRKRYNYR